MKSSAKWAAISIVFFYIISWLILIPIVNAELMQIPEYCLGEADKIYTPKPKGVALLLPVISYHSKVDMHIYIEHPYESEHNLETKVFLLAPFYATYKYNFESEGFRCGGNGKAYLWWNGIRIVRSYSVIT